MRLTTWPENNHMYAPLLCSYSISDSVGVCVCWQSIYFDYKSSMQFRIQSKRPDIIYSHLYLNQIQPNLCHTFCALTNGGPISFKLRTTMAGCTNTTPHHNTRRVTALVYSVWVFQPDHQPASHWTEATEKLGKSGTIQYRLESGRDQCESWFGDESWSFVCRRLTHKVLDTITLRRALIGTPPRITLWITMGLTVRAGETFYSVHGFIWCRSWGNVRI